MVSRKDRMLLKCSQYLEHDLRENILFVQLLFEDPFMGVIVTNDEQVYALGTAKKDVFGLGPVTETPKLSKIDVLCGKKIRQFAAGGDHVMALSQGGVVYTWGNASGQLGNNSQNDNSVPIVVAGDLKECVVKQVECGAILSVALSEDGKVFTWGSNGCGRTGHGTASGCTLSPKLVGGLILFDGKIMKIMAEGNTSFASDDEGNVYVWGLVDGNDVLLPTKSEIAFPEPSIKCTSSKYRSPLGKVVGDILNSFDNKSTADFVITVEGKDIHVHKAILQIRSPYFHTMFNNDWKETENAKVIISSHSYDVYYAFLRYIYCGELNDIGPDQSLRLMDLATMVLDDHLADLCSKRMKKSTTLGNLLKVYSVALVLEKEELMDFCVRKAVDGGLKEVVASDAYEEMVPEHVKKFVHQCMLFGAFDVK